MKKILSAVLFTICTGFLCAQEKVTDYVDPLIGS